MIKHHYTVPQNPTRVVVLGGSGFVGKFLVQELIQQHIDTLSLGSADINLLKPESVERLQGLLRSEDALVFCSALTPDKGKDIRTMMNNLKMAEHVCAALEKSVCSQVIYIGSDAVYEDSPNPARESSSPAPASLYAVMHLAREKMLVNTLAKSSTPLLILRPCAIYGVGDTHNGYGPNRFIRTARKEGQITLFGNGEEKRHHLYIQDFVVIITKCLQQKSEGSLNVVGTEAISFWEVAEIVSKLCQPVAQIKALPRQSPITHKHFDGTLLMKVLPKFAFTQIDRGLTETFREIK